MDANQAIAAGLLETTGQTPHATMGVLLYTDTLNAKSRFRWGDQSYPVWSCQSDSDYLAGGKWLDVLEI